MMKYIYIATAVAFLLMGITIKYLYSDNQGLSGKNITLEASNANLDKQLKGFANRPRTNHDVVNRLCDWAYSIDGDKKGRAKCRLPASTGK